MKITPLNVVSALGLVTAVLLLFNSKSLVAPANQSYKGLMIAVCLIAVFLSFLADQIFRKFVPTLGKIWGLQLALIAFTIVLLFVFKALIFN